MNYEIIWYLILGFAILAYTVLDGFDLGVGILHLFAKTDEQRRIFLNAIGPFWDGNTVWIVVVIGGLFAGFPDAYASLFSGFYDLLMILIAGFIFRAVAIEFRSKVYSPRWRQLWDVVFSASSHIVAFIIGVVLGNMIQGVPLNEQHDFIGSFALFFTPYTVLVGLNAVSLFAMHGTIYLAMKTEGEAHFIVRRWIGPAIGSFIFFFSATSAASLLYMPHMLERFIDWPVLFAVPLTAFGFIGNIFYQVRKGNDGWGFISSSISIALLLSLYGLGTYPLIIRSTIDPAYSISLFNSSSSEKTLGILLLIACIGVPFVLGYGFWIYRLFRGKVQIGKNSY